MKLKAVWIAVMIVVFAIVPRVQAGKRAGSDPGEPLVVHFEKNKTGLGRDDQARIRQAFQKTALNAAGRVFVVGYADSSGNLADNEQLALKRAREVRQAVIGASGLPPEQVIAVGGGIRRAVSGDGAKAAHAKDRRAEIYLVDAVWRDGQPDKHNPPLKLPAVEALLGEARTLVRRDHWDQALVLLHRARELGGEQVGEWHALYGIIGFFKGAPADRVRVHLQAALDHDGHNADARDFLSRVEARQNVFSGRVTAAMGRSPRKAIAVSTTAQQYEYLALFEALPRYHHRLDHLYVDVWECLNVQGEPVVYYFNHANHNDWAFGGSPDRDTVQAAVDPMEPTAAAASAADRDPPAPTMVTVRVMADPAPAHSTIWESKLFH